MEIPFLIKKTPIAGSEPDFYVYSKGNNAGKPSKERIPTGYSVYVNPNVLDTRYFMYVLEYLHSSGQFKKYLTGSVIEFIRIEDMQTVIVEFFRNMAAKRNLQERMEKMIGGAGDYVPDYEFDPEQLEAGIETEEGEHTADIDIAREIAKDHIIDEPESYLDSEHSSCGCHECEQCGGGQTEYEIEVMPTDGEQFMIDPDMLDQINMIKGNPDLNNDGMYSPEELYYHFDLNNNGEVSPDEYEEHVKWHADHPEIFNKKQGK